MKSFWLVSGLFGLIVMSSTSQADPTRVEVYSRYDNILRTTVYKDDLDSRTFWYVPPVSLYQENGKVVYYKRPNGNLVDLYLYLVPTISNEQLRILSQSIPGFLNNSQLKPVRLKRIGVSVQGFGQTEFSEEVTDLQYLNSPQTVKLSLSKLEAEDFEFLMTHKPGVQAKVLYNFIAQKVDQYIKIRLSAKQVYDALNIKATGQYIYIRAEIEAAIAKYIVNNNLMIERKGDLPIPEIVQKVITECFQPIQPKLNKLNYFFEESNDLGNAVSAEEKTKLEYQSNSFSADSLIDRSSAAGVGELNFQFKKELQSSTKVFYFSDYHYVDSTETVGVPVFFTTQTSPVDAAPKAVLFLQNNYTVNYFNEALHPLHTGINVQSGQQFVIQGVFLFSAQSSYSNYTRQYYKRGVASQNVTHELFYRIGDSPWQSVDADGIYDGRAVIRDNGLYTGELQFALDREKIWNKILPEYTQSKVLGMIPAIFTYQYSFPEFSVSISGKKFIK